MPPSQPTSTTSSQPTSQTTSQPLVLVEQSEHTSMDNFASTVSSAQNQLEVYLEAKLKAGYKYAGTIQREVGPETRNFYVFYAN